MPGASRREAIARTGVGCDERIPDSPIHLVTRGANGRPDPRTALRRIDCEHRNCRFDDPRGQATPARVYRCKSGAAIDADHDRQAIGGQDRSHAPGRPADHGIGLCCRGWVDAIKIDYGGPMDLAQKDRCGWQVEPPHQGSAVARNRCGIIAATVAEVRGPIGLCRDTWKVPGSDGYAQLRRPARRSHETAHARASRSARRLASRASRSAGRGALADMGLPVTGCANSSFSACRAWRRKARSASARSGLAP